MAGDYMDKAVASNFTSNANITKVRKKPNPNVRLALK